MAPTCRALAAEKVPVVQQSYASMRFDRACEAALSISSHGNQFLEETAPWTAFKKVRSAWPFTFVAYGVRLSSALLLQENWNRLFC